MNLGGPGKMMWLLDPSDLLDL